MESQEAAQVQVHNSNVHEISVYDGHVIHGFGVSSLSCYSYSIQNARKTRGGEFGSMYMY